MTAPPLLEIRDVTKSYGPVRALRGVSLDLAAGEVLGLCGHNGAGKSSLVRLLVGLAQPDDGQILLRGAPAVLRNPQDAQSKGIALVDQELSVAGVLTVYDNIFLGNADTPFLHRRAATKARARELLERVGLSHLNLSTPAAELAIGERQLIEIARLLGREASILILDEPTATLSQSEIAKVFSVVREVVDAGRSVIYVSHRLSEVLDLCDRVSVLRDGSHVATHPVDDIDRLGLVRLITGEIEGDVAATASAPAAAGASPVISVESLRVPGRLESFDLDVHGGEIIGLAGQLGSGTGEILRALAGLLPEASGRLHVAGRPVRLGSPSQSSRAGLAYCTNDRQDDGLFLGLTVSRNFTAMRLDGATRWGRTRRKLLHRMGRRLAELVGVPSTRLSSAVTQLSGGNQQKVLVGRILALDGARALLLDDPTRGVDVAARADIHALIRAAAADGVAVLVASTEMEELLDLSHQVVTLFSGRVVSRRPRGELSASRILGEMTMGDPAATEARVA